MRRRAPLHATAAYKRRGKRASAMARQVGGDTIGGRILLLCGERYPLTLAQVALALGLRRDVVQREARKLRAQGLVTLEPLGGDVFIALTGEGITFVGLSAADAERLRARRPPPPSARDEHDPAFG